MKRPDGRSDCQRIIVLPCVTGGVFGQDINFGGVCRRQKAATCRRWRRSWRGTRVFSKTRLSMKGCAFGEKGQVKGLSNNSQSSRGNFRRVCHGGIFWLANDAGV